MPALLIFGLATLATPPANADWGLIWSVADDGPASRSGRALAVAAFPDGSFVVSGTEDRSDIGEGNNWLVRKYTAAGAICWSVTYGSPGNSTEEPCAVAVDGDGNVVVAGWEVRSDLSQWTNWRIRKYGPAGNLLWSTSYDNPSHDSDTAYSVAVDSAGNIVVVGSERRPDLGQRGNWLIRKYSPAGGLLWSTDYNDPMDEGDSALGVTTDKDDNIIVVGTEVSPPMSAFRDWVVRKYGSSGNLLWSTTYDDPSGFDDAALAVATDADRNIVVVGLEDAPTTAENWRITKYDPAGTPLWSTGYDDPVVSVDQANAVAVDAEGNIAVVGVTALHWLIRRYGPSGNLLWSEEYVNPYGWVVEAYGAAFDPAGNLIVVGYDDNVGFGFGAHWLIRKYGEVPPSPPPPCTLCLREPGAALDRNAFSPARGESLTVRVLATDGSPLRIGVYTASGRTVSTLESRAPPSAGPMQAVATWDGRTDDGAPVSRGVYIIRVEGGGIRQLLKVVVR